MLDSIDYSLKLHPIERLMVLDALKEKVKTLLSGFSVFRCCLPEFVIEPDAANESRIAVSAR